MYLLANLCVCAEVVVFLEKRIQRILTLQEAFRFMLFVRVHYMPNLHCYFVSGRGVKYFDELFVIVCLFACPLAYLRNHTTELHQFFSIN